MKRIKIILPILLLLILLILPVKKALDNVIRVTYTANAYPESSSYLGNPYEGFYQIYGYVLKDDTSYPSIQDVPNVPKAEDQTEERLVQIQINLRNYAHEPISESALRQLDMILDAWSRTDRSIILRILYDWDGNAAETEADSIGLVMTHMEQTAAIYNKYADAVYLIQGLSTGNSGEMNNTRYGSGEDITLLAGQLAQVSTPSIYLSVRTPNHWRTITGADSYSELAAMSRNPFVARLGLYNDGMLGSETDTGTYTERSRSEELQFQNDLCRTVPNGGEVILDNPYNDLDNAIRDMRTMCVSYLNSGYDPGVINKWQKGIYRGADVFDGASGLEYIRNHLGYRYVLRDSQLLVQGFRHTALMITIENVGFSPSYRRFSFTLYLLNTETQECYTLTPAYDSTSLPGSAASTLEIPIDGHAYPPGVYELYWQTADDTSGEIIRYGNLMDLTQYGYRLGSMTIEAPYRRAER